MPYNVTTAMEGMPPDRTIDQRTLPPPVGDWSGMDDFSDHLKVWVSEEVDHAVDLLAQQYNNSKVVIVRNALVIHVFGRLAFDQAVMHGYLRAPRGYVAEVVNAKALYVAERKEHELGRQTDMARLDPDAHRELLAAFLPATVDMRVAVPPRLKAILQRLAEVEGRELSPYCREVLTTYFLGAARTKLTSG